MVCPLPGATCDLGVLIGQLPCAIVYFSTFVLVVGCACTRRGPPGSPRLQLLQRALFAKAREEPTGGTEVALRRSQGASEGLRDQMKTAQRAAGYAETTVRAADSSGSVAMVSVVGGTLRGEQAGAWA